ncbi:hypothetical protein VB264_06360 [Arcicella aquatica]|uniref:Uncharacterized protein n=1 Tax=Arcicella aquatica TaxID=217141 RepID=A0ABU5QK10_9BACT|nr:hypothetical protein [Arcicella aquatica]MEA5257398.1 hypothetical protein [Arcicella aquatica]
MDLQIVYIATVVICFFVSLLNQKHNEPYFKVFTFLLFVIIVVETSGYTINKVLKSDNQFLFHIYGPIEYTCIAYIYSSTFKNRIAKKITLFSIFIFIIFSAFSSLYLQTFTDTPYNFLLRCLLIIGLSLFYFYELYLKDEIIILTKLPMFWISVGNFFFYAGNFFLMGLIDTLERMHSDLVKPLFNINTILNIFLYVMFIVGFLCKRR